MEDIREACKTLAGKLEGWLRYVQFI